MNLRREMCQDCGRDLKDVAPEQPKASATAEAKGGSQQQLVSLPRELLQQVLENLWELRGERSWWEQEPRPKYQKGWKDLNDQIKTVRSILGQANCPLK